MRSNEVFGKMTPEEAEGFLTAMRAEASGAAQVALAAVAGAFKLRPEFLRRQPRKRQAEWMRRALARVTNAEAAEEVLAQYFLEARQELLVELLDALGVKHEDGRLEEPVSPPPTAAKLKKTVAKFQKGQERDKRDLLLRAFASQSAIDWPELDALLA
jgi:hypothetical protein